VREWFNKAAPRIKSGEVVVENIDPQTALVMMLKDPLLIRRPLMQISDRHLVGFEVAELDALIGLKPVDESFQAMSEDLIKQDLQGCAHGHNHQHQPGQGNCKH
jgi:nitrogenase-associated protein